MNQLTKFDKKHQLLLHYPHLKEENNDTYLEHNIYVKIRTTFITTYYFDTIDWYCPLFHWYPLLTIWLSSPLSNFVASPWPSDLSGPYLSLYLSLCLKMMWYRLIFTFFVYFYGLGQLGVTTNWSFYTVVAVTSSPNNRSD